MNMMRLVAPLAENKYITIYTQCVVYCCIQRVLQQPFSVSPEPVYTHDTSSVIANFFDESHALCFQGIIRWL